MSKTTTCCYFGIQDPDFGRNQITVRGLKENGVSVLFCVDSSKHILKFFRLIKKQWAFRDKYDFFLVAYLSNSVAPLARLISRKKVVFNALNSLYEATVLDRQDYSKYSIKGITVWVMDFFAFHMAHLSLVETESQKRFLQKMFKVPGRKLAVVYTGADDSVFHPDSNVAKLDDFTVVFRGWFIPGTGVEYVFETARILKDKGVRFVVIGRGKMQEKVERMMKEYNLTNVELTTEFLNDGALREKMLSGHVMLGQFADHERMDRTIQYKTFEALALGMPYVTRDSISNREILEDRKHCLFTKPASAEDIADKILKLKENPQLRDELGRNARKLFEERFTPKKLAQDLLKAVREK